MNKHDEYEIFEGFNDDFGIELENEIKSKKQRRKQMNKDYDLDTHSGLMGEKEFFDVMKKINRRINNEQRFMIAKYIHDEVLKDV